MRANVVDTIASIHHARATAFRLDLVCAEFGISRRQLVEALVDEFARSARLAFH